MATIKKIEGKKGVSYKLTAFCGYDKNGKQIRKFKTWTPDKSMTAKQAEKEALFQAQLFEDNLNKGLVVFDGKMKFEGYATKWLENAQIAPKTRERYKQLIVRINQAIGHLRLENVQAHHLEAFYKNLKEDGIKGTGRYAVAFGLDEVMDKRSLSRGKLSQMAGVSTATVSVARQGRHINISSAEKIAAALGVPVKQIFTIQETTSGLSDKTILHHHRLISAILGKAKKERIIPYNVAVEHTTAPKVAKKEAIYLDDVQARELVGLLFQEEDIRIKTATLLALYSGVRRGELCGLEWQDIDMENCIMHIMRASQYQARNGVVEVPTKNESSKRAIKMPVFIFEILADYRKWWLEQRLINGSRWYDSNRLFIQSDGKPIHPDTINFWLDKFIEKYALERFTPHSLRHTFATLQIMSGVNLKTLQARTGHAQASTLTNIYAHSIKTADELATEALDNVLTPKTIKSIG